MHLIGTSGTVTTLAGLHLGLERYERQKVDGLWMRGDDVDATMRVLLGMSFEKHHAALQQPVHDDAAEPLPRPVPAWLGLQRAHDPELPPTQRRETGECEQHQQADPHGAHRALPPRMELKRTCRSRLVSTAPMRVGWNRL